MSEPEANVEAVIHAATVWRQARREPIGGGTYHHACAALDDAIAVLLGQRDRVRVYPPTDDELLAGRDFVRRATAYGDALRIQKAAEQVKPSSTAPEPAGENL